MLFDQKAKADQQTSDSATLVQRLQNQTDRLLRVMPQDLRRVLDVTPHSNPDDQEVTNKNEEVSFNNENFVPNIQRNTPDDNNKNKLDNSGDTFVEEIPRIETDPNFERESEYLVEQSLRLDPQSNNYMSISATNDYCDKFDRLSSHDTNYFGSPLKDFAKLAISSHDMSLNNAESSNSSDEISNINEDCRSVS